jgi:hypothetical protein
MEQVEQIDYWASDEEEEEVAQQEGEAESAAGDALDPSHPNSWQQQPGEGQLLNQSPAVPEPVRQLHQPQPLQPGEKPIFNQSAAAPTAEQQQQLSS